MFMRAWKQQAYGTCVSLFEEWLFPPSSLGACLAFTAYRRLKMTSPASSPCCPPPHHPPSGPFCVLGAKHHINKGLDLEAWAFISQGKQFLSPIIPRQAKGHKWARSAESDRHLCRNACWNASICEGNAAVKLFRRPSGLVMWNYCL